MTDTRPKRSSAVDKDYRERKKHRAKVNEKPAKPEITTDGSNEPPQYEIIEQLYKDLIALKDPDEDYELCALFMELPSREEYPDYYETIKQPISLEEMKKKIDAKQYKYLSQFKSDLTQMVTNAKKYNIKESQVYEDATKIHKFVKKWQAPKAKALLKLPGGAFTGSGGVEASSPSSSAAASSLTPTRIKAIKLRAVEKEKPDVNMKELMQAIYKKETKKALELINAADKNINPNELISVEMFNDSFTWSPLHAAAYYGDIKVIDALMAKGANIEINDTWYSATPLSWAAYNDKDKVCRLLIEKYNADRNAENSHGQVPFDVVSDQDDSRWDGIFKNVDPKQQPSTARLTSTTTSAASARRLSPPQIRLQANPQFRQQVPSAQKQQQVPFIPQGPQPQQIIPSPQAAIQSQIPPARLQMRSGTQQMFQSNTPSGAPGETQVVRKRRGRPPKEESEAASQRPTREIDLNTIDPVDIEVELFNCIRTHTDNVNRLYSEEFEELPDRRQFPDYYREIKEPVSLSIVAHKMQTRAYVDLNAWKRDMVHVFENAMNYNEPGSRIHRDAKLLLRLLHRLQDRILGRMGVPISQEAAVMSMNLSSRPFDPEALNEERRKTKRYLTKTRHYSTEPEQRQHHHMAQHRPSQRQPQLTAALSSVPQQQVPNTIILQQQQQQQPQLQRPPFVVTPPSMLPPVPGPPMHIGPPVPHMPPPVMVGHPHQPSPFQPQPSMMMQPPMPTPQQMAFDMNGQFMPPPQQPRSPSAFTPYPSDMRTTNSPASQGSPLPKASKDFYALCQDGSNNIFIHELKITSPNNNSIQISVDGEYPNHSVSVPSDVDTLIIQPELDRALRAEEQRLSITILQNNVKLNTPTLNEWQSIPLSKGTNILKINLTANCTRPDSPMPEFITKTYHLFVTKVW
ncbi:hypothetical protein BDF20DRAFT_914267 [Mycotypha africana]|uniref:uncharacterized protein n=1 Tax=Mycotypha africana TaxID=64632 RepID=UPI0022FFC821|nr:uncharacterized protein BDF20DRAFT_914267 [Mycotypha africana]KAI8975321.1 hypothetical protein BDF20DRAFT_914267 [Mycotypha africana]